MQGLASVKDEIDGRITSVRQEIHPLNDPIINMLFMLEVNTLELLLQINDINMLKAEQKKSTEVKRIENEKCTDMAITDRLFVEIEVMEWVRALVCKDF